MIKASQFVEQLHAHGFEQYVGVPCSYLRPFINYVIDDPKLDYIGAASEGEAIGIGMGTYLGGRKTVAMCQNSGLGNMINPLTSLCHPFQIPLLLIVTWRGQPGIKDEPQHELMGEVTPKMLETIGVPWSLFPTEVDQMDEVLDQAEAHLAKASTPYALIMQKGSVEPHEITNRQSADFSQNQSVATPEEKGTTNCELPTRTEALEQIVSQLPADAVVIATTGKTGRELYTIRDHESHIYVVGGMGTASAIGLGVAHSRPDRKVVVIDGDGSLLMKMGALATIGFYRPENLVHIVLDNERHDSTGGQDTVSSIVRFDTIAQASNYRSVGFARGKDDFECTISRIMNEKGPVLLHAKIQPGSPEELGRPSIRPHEVKERMMKFLGTYPSDLVAQIGRTKAK